MTSELLGLPQTDVRQRVVACPAMVGPARRMTVASEQEARFLHGRILEVRPADSAAWVFHIL